MVANEHIRRVELELKLFARHGKTRQQKSSSRETQTITKEHK
ncbi:hypothetical protein HMPREF0091_10802 [Fannyhessea vaginae DSM 15829]|uniref:Uncharacterized protein n=1 Tax=Fannyhessea vaginae DSM 15829 TaxID=525256 RepID=F1T5C4_9ACTN|nr:hypothetical protein HMPREF0091_10802 [Fannyhessea vaginae DSM 15829]